MLFRFKNSPGENRCFEPSPGALLWCFCNPVDGTVVVNDYGKGWPKIGAVVRIEGNDVWVAVERHVVDSD